MTVTLSPWEYAARAFDPPVEAPPRWATPGALARELDPRTVNTPALDLIDDALVDLADGKDNRLAIFMSPQEGKSERASHYFPLWMLTNDPECRIAIISYSGDIARRWGWLLRQDIETFNGQDGNVDLGLRLGPRPPAGRFNVEGHRGSVYCVGIAGALTGRAVDLLIIDDPLRDMEQASSIRYRDRAWMFWQAVAIPRMGPNTRTVLIQTRWHEDDLAGRLLQNEGRVEDGGNWRVISIPAQADHDPNKGEADLLGREPGEYMESTRGRTAEQWAKRRKDVGSYVWAALFQQRPAPAEGGLFKREWWREYDGPQWIDLPSGAKHVPLDGDAELCISWDMAFKDLDDSDFVCGQVWLRRGVDAYLLDQIRDRLSFVETCQAVRQLAARWPQAVAKYVEDKANGTAVINQLRRTVGGLIAVEPEGSKVSRAAAVSPFIEAGNVWLPAPELAPWVGDLIEEHAAFPNAANDDQVDSLSQALNRLLLNPLLVADEIVEDEQFDDLAISDY